MIYSLPMRTSEDTVLPVHRIYFYSVGDNKLLKIWPNFFFTHPGREIPNAN